MHVVWGEARKALEIERLGRLTTAFRFDIESYTRELDPGARTVVSYQSRRQSGLFSNPFRSLPPAQLASGGYHRRTASGDVLYAPTPDVLLSDAFLDSHCFNLSRDATSRPGQIGLAFEPLPGPNTDVAGVLWLDDASAELRELEYRYERLPRDLPAGPSGGRASFQRLPNGAWIVRDWRIRSPIVGVSQQRVLGDRREVEQLLGVFEEGAEVVRVTSQTGTVIEDRERATLAGRVAEDARGGPMEGARIRVIGTELSATTDVRGSFRIAGVPEGTYRLVIDHPRLEDAGFLPDTLTVDLANGQTTEVTGTLPTLEALLAQQRGPAWQDSLAAVGRLLGRPDFGMTVEARGEANRNGGARVHGRILSHETGRPLEGVLVRIEGTSSSAVTTGSGRFVLRDVPPGERRLVAEMIGYETSEHAIELGPNQAVDAEFRMTTRAIELEPIEVAVRSRFLEGHGFYERRDMSVTGRFITRAEIELARAGAVFGPAPGCDLCAHPLCGAREAPDPIQPPRTDRRPERLRAWRLDRWTPLPRQGVAEPHMGRSLAGRRRQHRPARCDRGGRDLCRQCAAPVPAPVRQHSDMDTARRMRVARRCVRTRPAV